MHSKLSFLWTHQFSQLVRSKNQFQIYIHNLTTLLMNCFSVTNYIFCAASPMGTQYQLHLLTNPIGKTIGLGSQTRSRHCCYIVSPLIRCRPKLFNFDALCVRNTTRMSTLSISNRSSKTREQIFLNLACVRGVRQNDRSLYTKTDNGK